MGNGQSFWREAGSVSSVLLRVLESQRVRVNPKAPDELVFRLPKGTPLKDKDLYNGSSHRRAIGAGSRGYRGTRSVTLMRRSYWAMSFCRS